MVVNGLRATVRVLADLLPVGPSHYEPDVLSDLVSIHFLEESIEVVPLSGSVLVELEWW